MTRAGVALGVLAGCWRGEPAAAPAPVEAHYERVQVLCPEFKFKHLMTSAMLVNGTSAAPTFDVANAEAENDSVLAQGLARTDMLGAAKLFMSCAERFRSVSAIDPLLDTAYYNATNCYENAMYAYAMAGRFKADGERALQQALRQDVRMADELRRILGVASEGLRGAAMTMWRLDGKTALVTGGSKGIGRAVVDELVALGAQVVVVAREKPGIAETIAAHGGAVTGVAADVTVAADRERIVQAAPAKLDILVHNAGGNIRKPLTGYDDATLAQIVELNLMAPLSLSRDLHGRLVAAGSASVIHVGSVAGIVALATGVAYGAAKAGLAQATRTLALEWARDGIRVNTVAPWYTRTDLVASVLAQPKRLDAIIARTPLGRVAEPAEVAAAIVFLALPAASYITGQCLAVDGGMSIQGLAYAP